MQFPKEGVVFDYFVSETDAEGNQVPNMANWTERVPQYLHTPESDHDGAWAALEY